MIRKTAISIVNKLLLKIEPFSVKKLLINVVTKYPISEKKYSYSKTDLSYEYKEDYSDPFDESPKLCYENKIDTIVNEIVYDRQQLTVDYNKKVSEFNIFLGILQDHKKFR